MFCAWKMMLLDPDEAPLAPGVGWILTGKATRADAEDSPADPRGISLVRLERRGEMLLRRFGVLRETTGVVSDSMEVLEGLRAPPPAARTELPVLATVVTANEETVEDGSGLSIPTIGGGELGAWMRRRRRRR